VVALIVQMLVLKCAMIKQTVTMSALILIHGMTVAVFSVEMMILYFMKQAVLMQDILLVMAVDAIPAVMAYQLLMQIVLEEETYGVLIPMKMEMI